MRGVDRLPLRAWLRLDGRDLAWLLGIVVLAAVLRFGSPFFFNVVAHPFSQAPITAWGIGHDYQDPTIAGLGQTGTIAPQSPFVFDELYFANDAHDDLQGKDYLDPEPPLAKLVIALGIKLFGFNSFGWRVGSAVFGTLLCGLMYLLARQLVTMRFFAITAGLLTTLDGMTFVESRTAVIDIFPITFAVLAYLLFHLHLRADTVFRQRLTIILTGGVLGLALGSKWTALAAYGTIVVILVVMLIRRSQRYDRGTGATAAVSLGLLPGLIYLLTFTHYLTISHSLDGYAAASLSFHPFHLDATAAWRSLANWHRWAFTYHYTLRAPHPYYSPWFSWPILYRPVAYYYASQHLGLDPSGQQLVAEIFNLGNPIIWWAGVAAMVPVMLLAVIRRSYPAAFIAVAFFAAWLPFSRVPRGLFLYHMLGGLPFMFLAVALVLTQARTLRWRRFPFINGVTAGYAYLATMILFFCYFYPLWTGLPVPYPSWLDHMWLPKWI